MDLNLIGAFLTLATAVSTFMVAWRTYILQRLMEQRDRTHRQDRARYAVITLWRHLHIIETKLAGATDEDIAREFGARWDILETIRPHMSELAWVPDCQWKEIFTEMVRSALPKGSLGSAAVLARNRRKISECYRILAPWGEAYKECMRVISDLR